MRKFYETFMREDDISSMVSSAESNLDRGSDVSVESADVNEGVD